MPYLIGVPKDTFQRQNMAELGDVVVMDLDEKVLTSPYDDKLPSDVFNFLRARLKCSNDAFLSDAFSRAFLQTNVLLFGYYTMGFVKGYFTFAFYNYWSKRNLDERGTFSWDRHLFVERQRPTLRPYLHSLIGKDGVQYFERFVEERLVALNEKRVIIDEFEREIQLMELRKGGSGSGALVRKF